MIVYQAHRLHERITDSRSNKLESSTKQIAADGVRLRSTCGNLLKFTPPVYARRPANKGPNVGVEASEFPLNCAEGLRVPHRADDLQTIANNAGITKETFDSCRRKSGYTCRIEIGERIAIGLALLENRFPAQAGLRTFKGQKLEKNPVTVNWHSPFRIVICDA